MRQRLDQVLVERGLCESREKAKRAVMAGAVRVNGSMRKWVWEGAGRTGYWGPPPGAPRGAAFCGARIQAPGEEAQRRYDQKASPGHCIHHVYPLGLPSAPEFTTCSFV